MSLARGRSEQRVAIACFLFAAVSLVAAVASRCRRCRHAMVRRRRGRESIGIGGIIVRGPALSAGFARPLRCLVDPGGGFGGRRAHPPRMPRSASPTPPPLGVPWQASPPLVCVAATELTELHLTRRRRRPSERDKRVKRKEKE